MSQPTTEGSVRSYLIDRITADNILEDEFYRVYNANEWMQLTGDYRLYINSEVNPKAYGRLRGILNVWYQQRGYVLDSSGEPVSSEVLVGPPEGENVYFLHLIMPPDRAPRLRHGQLPNVLEHPLQTFTLYNADEVLSSIEVDVFNSGSG